MTPKTPLGDRREHLRFDVNGQLWASLNFGERVILRNVATGGALIETTLKSALTPIRAAQISLRDGGPTLNVLVRHVSPVTNSPDGSDRYLVGLEFVNVAPSARLDIEQLVREWQARPRA